ncbi:DUF1223 domain-containing protein [Paludibacter sp. 221]|uniref:Omp28 family outer membrane lipoprotein n=1 Tax=Paludibacter sp. 221 TaxID=2302939 RepID=UPI0013D83043|nr:Omp28 family outer membrane lipoprotein [Paludibacter sp. 221]NDV47184.1 DUF1223 domain-containing protein [Paludibacter sp. 221]
MDKIYRIFIFCILLSGLLAACDVIGEGDRVLEMDEIIPQKKVLLVDFTDQSCANCPNAAQLVEELEEDYKEAFIPVSMHAYFMKRPLVTDEGNVYEKHFGTDQTGHPTAVIDGVHISSSREQWRTLVINRFNVSPAVKIELNASVDADNQIQVSTKIKAERGLAEAKLLLWLIEDNIEEIQLMPDGTTKKDYIHQHVFRSSVNGTWGEQLTLAQDEEKEIFNHILLKEGWNQANIFIVGFIFDADTNEVYNSEIVRLN